MTTGLPHVRGGVSETKNGKMAHYMSSPRAWGCFLILFLRRQAGKVFPTCVGVFLSRISRKTSHCRLPHVRGGVSPSQHR